MTQGAPAHEKEPEQKQWGKKGGKDVKSIHRCWLENFLGAAWNHKAAEMVWQIDTRCSSTVVQFAPLSCFNSLYKRPSLHSLKASGRAPARVDSPSDVQMMKRIMSRCTLCSQIISTCFMSRWKNKKCVWWDVIAPKVPSQKRRKNCTSTRKAPECSYLQ